MEELRYVWIHPVEQRMLGLIVSHPGPTNGSRVSMFTAFKMPTKVSETLK